MGPIPTEQAFVCKLQTSRQHHEQTQTLRLNENMTNSQDFSTNGKQLKIAGSIVVI